MYQLLEPFEGGHIPAAIKERYRVADGPAIKVALFLLFAGSGDDETVADALSLPVDTVTRALAFWSAAGLITDDPAAVRAPAAAPELIAPERPPLSRSQVSGMMLEVPELAVLVQETQNLLGRTLDDLESRILMEIYEYEQLPVDVILMIIAFCLPRAKNKRTVISRAARTATSWRERGINSAGAAEAHLRLLEQRELREREVAAVLELENAGFTAAQRGHIARWYEEYGYNADFVKEAYLRTGNNAVAYLNSVLKSWRQHGYVTIRDTRSAPSNTPAPVSKKKRGKGGDSLLKKAINQKNYGGVATDGI